MTHPNNLGWTHYAAASLPLWQRARFHWHLRWCGACRARAVEVTQQRAAHRDSAAYDRGLSALQARLGKRPAPRPALPWFGALAALSSAALVGLAVLPPQEESLRAKGGDHFVLYVQRGSEVLPLGTQCQAGDSLRARYRSARGYLMVVEVDGSGQAQVVYPAQGSESAAIGSEASLTPGSWVLDRTPERERFVAVFSAAPLQAQRVLQAVRSGTALNTPETSTLEVSCEKAP